MLRSVERDIGNGVAKKLRGNGYLHQKTRKLDACTLFQYFECFFSKYKSIVNVVREKKILRHLDDARGIASSA